MEILKIALEIILTLIGFYIIFFKNYFKAKAENLATKEDIGEITKEIEKVKNEFSFYNQKKSDFFFETKKNLIKFYDNYFLWVNDSMRIADIILSHHSNNKIIRECINNLKEKHTDVQKNYSRLMIYINDQDFNSTITIIYGDTINNHNSILRFLLTLEDISIKHKYLKKRVDFAKNKVDAENIAKEYEILKIEKEKCFDKFKLESDELKKSLSKNKQLLSKTFKKKIIDEYAITYNII